MLADDLTLILQDLKSIENALNYMMILAKTGLRINID